MILVVIGAVGQAPKEGPATAAQMRTSINNLKQIGLAFHNYHETFGYFPQAALTDKAGKPLLSWRVAILPFVEQDALYKQFKLDESWDSDHNKPLLARMPKLYAPVRKKSANGDETYYRGFSGEKAFFEPTIKLRIAQIPDGTSNTLMIVEAGESVPWSKPDELAFDPSKKLPALGGMFDGAFHVAFADGSVRKFNKGKQESTLLKLITRNGGEVLEAAELKP